MLTHSEIIRLRTTLIEAIHLLRSGAIDPYQVLLAQEHHGEDSGHMRIQQGVLEQMMVSDDELQKWQVSYQQYLATRVVHPMIDPRPATLHPPLPLQ